MFHKPSRALALSHTETGSWSGQTNYHGATKSFSYSVSKTWYYMKASQRISLSKTIAMSVSFTSPTNQITFTGSGFISAIGTNIDTTGANGQINAGGQSFSIVNPNWSTTTSFNVTVSGTGSGFAVNVSSSIQFNGVYAGTKLNSHSWVGCAFDLNGAADGNIYVFTIGFS